MQAIESLTRLAKFIAFGFILGVVVSCAGNNYVNNKSVNSDDNAIYFVGLNGISISLKSIDNFRTAVMQDSRGMKYNLKSSSKNCMSGDARVCFSDKFATVELNDGSSFKVVPVPKIEKI